MGEGLPNPSSPLFWSLQGLAGLSANIGALIMRIGLGGRLYYTYSKKRPKPCSFFEGSYIRRDFLSPWPYNLKFERVHYTAGSEHVAPVVRRPTLKGHLMGTPF